ncbi:MAG: GNAT family N-acetyltransferase [Cyclobacteriaceae bacterium]|nr:GNAT family N-acetyltransferase [Cyclobacteriaceae bacterium]
MVKIRNAKETDLKDIASFQVLMAKETEDLQLDEKTVYAGVKAVMDDPSKGRYFVAEANGQAVASLLITYEWSDWRNGNIFWIQSVYVLPEYRKQGIFRNLYLHVKALAEASADIAGIRLYMELNNGRARKVYENMGMQNGHYEVFEWMKNF